MDAPSFQEFPENNRPLGLLFSNNLNLHIKISNFLAKSDNFEHFLSVLTHFVLEKIDFEIFNFLNESEDSEQFLKNSIFENFYKCFDPFCMGKKNFEVQIFNSLNESLEN